MPHPHPCSHLAPLSKVHQGLQRSDALLIFNIGTDARLSPLTVVEKAHAWLGVEVRSSTAQPLYPLAASTRA